jgi:hypothetical protein
MKHITKILVLSTLLLTVSFSVTANETQPPRRHADEPNLLDTLVHFRNKQMGEERRQIRVIQTFANQARFGECSPLQMSRQRLRDVGQNEHESETGMNIEVGHRDMTINDNLGEVNNQTNVNVMVEGNHEKRCL